MEECKQCQVQHVGPQQEKKHYITPRDNATVTCSSVSHSIHWWCGVVRNNKTSLNEGDIHAVVLGVYKLYHATSTHFSI